MGSPAPSGAAGSVSRNKVGEESQFVGFFHSVTEKASLLLWRCSRGDSLLKCGVTAHVCGGQREGRGVERGNWVIFFWLHATIKLNTIRNFCLEKQKVTIPLKTPVKLFQWNR